MKSLKNHAVALSLLLNLLVFSAFAGDLQQQRIDFLVAEKAIADRDDATFFSLNVKLVDYPLFPYLQYLWLKNHLANTEQVRNFIELYKDDRYAQLLKEEWINFLSMQHQWQTLIDNYSPSHNQSLACRYYWSQYQIGQQEQALQQAKNIWLTSDELPLACDELFNKLIASFWLTHQMIQQRFEQALQQDDLSLAIYIQHFFSANDKSLANEWLKAHRNPGFVLHKKYKPFGQERIFAHAISILAKSQLEPAIKIWDSYKPQLPLTLADAEKADRAIALALAKKHDPRAYERLTALKIITPEINEWKFRIAAMDQNWQQISQTLKTLSPEERKEPKWQYWLARDLYQKGDLLQAYILLYHLAKDRSLYGFLAADYTAQPYNTINKPVPLINNALEQLQALPNFKVFAELKYHHREVEAKRQWWYAVSKLDKEQQKVAAKLAQKNEWLQLAIITMVKADYWDDLGLRFPVRHLNEVNAEANSNQLNPALILGLIRQESMLDRFAESAVGALGLMQLMPQTAKEVARELGELWRGEQMLFNPAVNIRYGSRYYKKMLQHFKHNFVITTAAYNAGPGRVREWLPENRVIPADIWIEAIPLKETRKYVSSVLTYTIIYQALIQANPVRISQLMQDIM